MKKFNEWIKHQLTIEGRTLIWIKNHLEISQNALYKYRNWPESWRTMRNKTRQKLSGKTGIAAEDLREDSQ